MRAHVPEATRSPRIERVGGSNAALLALLRKLVEVSRHGLPQMYRSDRGMFAHTLRRRRDGRLALCGTSLRYGAIVLRGARWLDEEGQREVLGGEGAAEFCSRLVRGLEARPNLGDLALVTWNAASLGHAETGRLVEDLRARVASQPGAFTVELAWALSAFTAAHDLAGDSARQTCARLLAARPGGGGIFPHQVGGRGRALRRHVASFADQVYPIQALSRFHRVCGDERALAAADRCAEAICRLQGPQGEWWWHYDVRTGGVVEGYPVYSVHQDAMGPMALLDLAEAGGVDHVHEVRSGLLWLQRAALPLHSLVDEEKRVIWRKLGRREPGKLVRQVRAATTAVCPGFRLRMLDAIFPAVRVDWESRPYHLGWVLDSWLGHL